MFWPQGICLNMTLLNLEYYNSKYEFDLKRSTWRQCYKRSQNNSPRMKKIGKRISPKISMWDVNKELNITAAHSLANS